MTLSIQYYREALNVDSQYILKIEIEILVNRPQILKHRIEDTQCEINNLLKNSKTIIDSKYTIVFLYMDDLLIIGDNRDDIELIEKHLKKDFEMTELGKA